MKVVELGPSGEYRVLNTRFSEIPNLPQPIREDESMQNSLLFKVSIHMAGSHVCSNIQGYPHCKSRNAACEAATQSLSSSVDNSCTEPKLDSHNHVHCFSVKVLGEIFSDRTLEHTLV